MRLVRGLALTLMLVPAALHAQDASLQAGLRVTQLRAEPAEVRVTAGQKVAFRVVGLDAQGNVVEGAAVRVTARRSGDGAVNVANDSVAGLVAGTNEIVLVEGLRAGKFEAPRGFQRLHVYPDATTGEEWHVIALDLTS